MFQDKHEGIFLKDDAALENYKRFRNVSYARIASHEFLSNQLKCIEYDYLKFIKLERVNTYCFIVIKCTSRHVVFTHTIIPHYRHTSSVGRSCHVLLNKIFVQTFT